MENNLCSIYKDRPEVCKKDSKEYKNKKGYVSLCNIVNKKEVANV